MSHFSREQPSRKLPTHAHTHTHTWGKVPPSRRKRLTRTRVLRPAPGLGHSQPSKQSVSKLENFSHVQARTNLASSSRCCCRKWNGTYIYLSSLGVNAQGCGGPEWVEVPWEADDVLAAGSWQLWWTLAGLPKFSHYYPLALAATVLLMMTR